MNQMKELVSLPPRPPSLPTASPRRRFAKLGRKISDGSQQSASSTGSSSSIRSAEGASIKLPNKITIRHHTNRLSSVFLRGSTSRSGSMALTAGLRSSLSIHARKGSSTYGLGKEEAESYVLCDAIGSINEHQWRMEGFRVVGDNEKPLLLQSLWKPREGLARRFEIQKRSLVEEKISRDKDTITAGINAQARKLQKSRSRVTSTLIHRTVGRSHKLWRSKSEMDLLDSDTETNQDTDHDKNMKDGSKSLDQRSPQSCRRPKTSPAQNYIKSLETPHHGFQAKTETLCLPRPKGEREGEESQREEESRNENTTQYAIHPPHDCPYLLLLQGCSSSQDFLIYLLVGPETVIGRRGDPEDHSKADILLFATDILQRHCCFHRRGDNSLTVLCPCQGAVVTRNGKVLKEEVQLSPGDVIGLGQRYLFLFKDPVTLKCKGVDSAVPEPSLSAVPWMLHHNISTTKTSHSTDKILCSTCISPCTDLQSQSSQEPLGRSFSLLQSPEGHSLTLNYDPEDEDVIVREIIAMGSSRVKDRPVLTAAFLLCILSSEESDSEDLQPLGMYEVISGLRPLVVWMSNSLELLQFIQYQLPLILEWRTRVEQGQEGMTYLEKENMVVCELKEPHSFSADQDHPHQLNLLMTLGPELQKGMSDIRGIISMVRVLYPILPGLLDCNPFRENPKQQVTQERSCLPGSYGLQVPAEIQQVVEVLDKTWVLLTDCSEPGFYQWSRGVQMRANLDLTSWTSLRSDYPYLSPAQLNHLLGLYSPASPCRHMWTPSAQDDAAAHKTADILESFDTHHPLMLPAGGYQLQVRRPVTDAGLKHQLDRLKEFIPEITAAREPQETVHSHPPLPPSPPSLHCPLSTHCLDEFSSCSAVLLSQKLRHLEVQIQETMSSEVRRSPLDPPCLLTPPNTPHIIEPVDPMHTDQDKRMKTDSGLVFECLSALRADHLRSDCPQIIEEEGEQNGEEEEDHYNDSNEVFSLELERVTFDPFQDTSCRVKGIFIRAVVPDSPAARCEKLVPGDRILAVNGVSLLGLDYQSGKELIQSSGDRLRLLMARCDWMAKAIQTDC
ncbi:hypothetical protein INR49_000927 [Caranx melampygus]|nr:hypothetical protein INR49_000927 [Caranx melampygus]